MNGAQHYRAAERLLAKAGDDPTESGAADRAAAQVHATLALVAATVSAADVPGGDDLWYRALRGGGG